MNLGELPRALAATEAELQKFPHTDSEWHWRFMILKAEILVRQRQNKQALTLMEPELPASLQATDVAVWQKLIQGTARARLREFDQARRLLDDAEALTRRYNTQQLGEAKLRQGTLAFLEGDTASAATHFRSALAEAISHEDRFLQTAALGSLGLVTAWQQHFDESIEWNNAALKLSRATGAKISSGRILGNMGWSYFELGDYEESLELSQQAEQVFAEAGAPELQIEWLGNAGLTYYFLRNYAAAEQESQKALELSERNANRSAVAECRNILALIYLAQGRLDDAERNNSTANRVAQEIGYKQGEASGALISARIQEARGRYREAEHTLAGVLADQAAATSLRWEAEALLGKAYDEEKKTKEAESGYRHAIESIESARTSVGQDELRLTFLSSAINFYDDYLDFLITHDRADDALRLADLTRSRTLLEGLTAKGSSGSAPSGLGRAPGFSPAEISRKLHAPLLLYWLGRQQSYLWVITPTKVVHFELPKEDEIEPLVKRYRQGLLDGQDVLAADNADGKRLYEILVAPAEKLIPRDSRVVVLPAESLYGLNFETLIVPGPQPHFWIEDATISTASSLGLLAAASMRRTSATSKSLLLVGDAVPANADFPKLAQAPAEMQKVAGHFPREQETLLNGTAATPSAYLKSDPGKFSYLHFVTHGTASHTRPLESAVILSKEGDSYKLYARDIVQHPLSAELVTISACNGAGTRAYAGEGLVGLSWAFLRAGAHNVIGALWEVSDASSTPRLMDALYTGLDRGEDPAVALRQAKLEILHSSDSGVFRKPFYWAPFQLYSGMGATKEKAGPVKAGATAR